MPKLEEYFSSKRIDAARTACKQFVGRKMKVQESKHMYTEGEIISAEPSYVTLTRATAHMIYKVDMLCGTKRVLRTFHLKRIVAQ